MHSFVRGGLLAATALVSTGAFSSIAHAAATSAAGTSAAGASAVAEVPAEVTPDAAAADGQTTSVGTGASDSNEILVTARHRAESSQSVPLAIAVIGGEHIDNTGSFNVGRLQQLTPTLQFSSSNPRNTSVNIRGIGAPLGLTNDGIEQGVGIYVDDVYSARVASATFDFLDVAQIEVLRGPQGTLYGKNTTAGAITISTRQPTFEYEGRAEVSVGNLGFVQAKGAVSGPITDTVAVRLAASRTTRDGTIYNVATKQDVNSQDNLGLRGQLLWKPNDALSITLAGDYSEQDPRCCATVYVRTGSTQRPVYRQYAALAAAQGYVTPSTNPFDRVTDVDATLSAKNKIGGVSLRGKLELPNGDTLTSITAWRFWRWGPSNDRDFTGLPITTKSQNPSQQNQYTQEFRYSHSGPGLDITAGLFGFYQTVRTQGTQQLGTAASRWLLNPGNISATYLTNPAACATLTTRACNPATLDGLTSSNDIRLDNLSVAFYTQLAGHITDRFTIQPGLRVNYDRKKGLYNAVVTNKAGAPVVFEVNPDGSSANSSTEVDQLGQMAPETFTPKFSAWNVSFDLTAKYDVTPDIHAYATYARTFKSGGINLNGVPAAADGTPLLQYATAKPERLNHYEAGIKTQFLNRTLTINLSAFLTDIDDYQAIVNNGAVSALRGYVDNADKVRTKGVEWDTSWRPSDRFNVYFNGAYTDAKYVRFTNAPPPPELSGGPTTSAAAACYGNPNAGVANTTSPTVCDVSGQTLPGISKWSLSYGGEINQPVGSLFGKDGEVYLGVDGNFRTRFSSNASPSAYTWIESYALTNVRAGFRTDHGIDIYGWVRNAFDVKYFDLLQVAPGSTGLIVGTPGDPRTYGITAKVQF